LSLECSRDERD